MQYAIFVVLPRYGSRDEITGWVTRRWNDNAYQTLAYAKAVAARAAAEGYESGGDVSLQVRLANGGQIPAQSPAPAGWDDEAPF